MSDLAEQANVGEAPGWKPEENDLLIGRVVDLSTGWSDYKNAYYPIVTIQPDLEDCVPNPPNTDAEPGSPIAVHGFQFVLEDKFTALRPAQGERIAIKMGPQIPTKDGKRTVQTYTVKMDRTEDIWDKVKSPRAAAEQAPTRSAQQSIPVTDVSSDDDIPF